MMVSRAMRALLMAVCATAFVCLLLSGAPRLIASGEETADAPAIAVQSAALSAPAREDGPDAAGQTQTGAGRGERVTEPASLVAPAMPALRRDANGNVLAHESYLRTVYRAFSLGDGFV